MAAYRIDVPPAVEKSLDALDEKAFARIDKIAAALSLDPRPPGCKKLGGSVYRVRMGDWRLIYAVFDRQRWVQLIRLARRSGRTYKHIPGL